MIVRKLNKRRHVSLIAHMESLLSERNPLYGMRTFSLSLEPMSLREAVQFLPNYSVTDQIAAYAIRANNPSAWCAAANFDFPDPRAARA